ncbi:two-component regulator propeller domain-containing protein [Tahibacter amnicola]|uniref:histidine kinase n=1 Tax=Tahibacter amnicola TaxID=2976241 RepID=A0ABY6BEQ7_9GAMM|nr:two-component regulator propeller domain-containing protein [Tahibacter amnicola]UXI66835.1 ATP-binding protein [Tahibacter amnicola]
MIPRARACDGVNGGVAIAGRWVLYGLLLLLCAQSARAVDPYSVRFQNYAIEDGLSHNRVRSLAQDRDGYLWVATRDGLNRFDGRDFRVYKHDPSDPHSLPDNVVMVVATSPEGILWLGTASGGLAYYDAEHDRFIRYRADTTTRLANNYVRSLHFDRQGTLWVGCFGAGVQRFDRLRGVATDAPFGRPTGMRGVHRMVDLPDGGMLFVAGDAIWRWDGRSDQLASFLPVVRGEVQRSTEWAILDANDEVWVVFIEGDLLRLNLDGKVLARYHTGPRGDIKSGEVMGIVETRSGDLWLGTTGGVAWFDRAANRFVDVFHDRADPASPPMEGYVMFEDRDGLIWLGSTSHGLGMHDPTSESVTIFRHHAMDKASLPTDEVRAILPEPDGTFWLGLAGTGGLVHFRPGEGVLARFRHDPADPGSLASDAVSALARGRDGTLWVGFDASGFDRLDPGSRTFHHYRSIAEDPASLPGNLVNGFYVDADDTLWVALDGGGLVSLCKGCTAFKRYYSAEGDPFEIAESTAIDIAQTPDGAIWVGLFGGGVARLDPATGQLERYVAKLHSDEGPANDLVRSLYVDASGTLWLGSPAGLDRVERDPRKGRVSFIHQRHPTWSARGNITCLVADASGVLWAGTSTGLIRFDRAVGIPEIVGRMANRDRASYSNNACAAVGNTMYFGTAAGLIRFDPGVLQPLRSIGPVVVNELLLFNTPIRPSPDDDQAPLQQTLPYTERVNLNYQQSVFGFGFAALDFREPSRVYFRYRLDGLHDSWVPVLPNQRSVTFTGVPYGSYRFRVQAWREGSEPRETGVDVRLVPPPWRSLWAYGLYALMAVATLVAVLWRYHRRLAYERYVAATIRQSEEALRRLNDELESRVAARTSALSQTNVELTLTLAQLREAQQQLVEAEKMASLGGLVAGIAHEINTPLGVCLTAATHLEEQSRQLASRMQTGELRRSELDQYQRMAIESVELILRNLQRADRLVRSFKQTAVDQSTDEWRELDLEQSVRDTLSMIGPVLRVTPHRVTVECPSPVKVFTSGGAVYQIVSNLVLNAIQHAFVPDRPGEIRITIGVQGDLAGLTIADNGRGMDVEERTRAFDPFFTTRRGQGGSGLGLHIVYNLVTQILRGRILCESAPGRGTRFEIQWSPAVGQARQSGVVGS